MSVRTIAKFSPSPLLLFGTVILSIDFISEMQIEECNCLVILCIILIAKRIGKVIGAYSRVLNSVENEHMN